MAKAKFDKLNNQTTTSNDTQTHASLQQTKKAGRPKGSTTKKEQSNESITIAITPSQKRALESYAENEFRSVGSVIKMLLIQNGIIEKNS
ncbi:MAG: hypothetical protein U9N42_03380 [Campylobacterota bacterium]|nr:hypothetical protein [Campylobacterota bacterium]